MQILYLIILKLFLKFHYLFYKLNLKDITNIEI